MRKPLAFTIVIVALLLVVLSQLRPATVPVLAGPDVVCDDLASPCQYVFISVAYRGPEGSEPTATATATPTATATASQTATETPTASASATGTQTATATPTSTATATATSVPPCNGVAQTLGNTSFEGTFSPWFTSGAPMRTTTHASAGAWSVLMGGYNNARDAIGDFTTVPVWAETAALYFDAVMYSSDSLTSRYDRLGVSVYRSGVTLAEGAVWNDDVTGIWQQWKLTVSNISAWRGQQIGIMLTGLTDGTYPTKWYVDNVRFYFGCGSTPALAEGQELSD